MDFTPAVTINNNARMVTVAEILKEVEPQTGGFPMGAMRSAVNRRGAITPQE